MIGTDRGKVLIVGGSLADTAAVRQGLVADGCLVRFSETAEGALEMSKAWKPEVVVADDAVAEIIASLRRLSIDVPVLIRSRSRAAFAKFLDNGADDCVEKSCSVAELRARIRAKLKQSRRSTGVRVKREG